MIPFSTDRNYFDIQAKPIHNSTKKSILEIAIDLFSRKGYTGVSIRDITKEVGIKESSLYKHYQSKDEILETIFSNFRKEVSMILPPLDRLDGIVTSLDPEEFLVKGLQNFKDHVKDPVMQKIWRIVYIEQYRDPLAKDIYFNDILYKTIDFMELAFDKMVSLHRIKPMNGRTLAIAYQYPIFTMISEYIMLKSEAKETVGVEKGMAEHIQFINSVIKV